MFVMKRYSYFTIVVAMAILAVSCAGGQGINPDVPEIIDSFLGDVAMIDEKENEANFETLTDILQNNCCLQSDYYQKNFR